MRGREVNVILGRLISLQGTSKLRRDIKCSVVEREEVRREGGGTESIREGTERVGVLNDPFCDTVSVGNVCQSSSFDTQSYKRVYEVS